MNNLKKARLILGLTQAEVAEALGVSVVSVNRWETGRGSPKVKRLKEVASVLHLTVPELLGEPMEGRGTNGAAS